MIGYLTENDLIFIRIILGLYSMEKRKSKCFYRISLVIDSLWQKRKSKKRTVGFAFL